MASIAARAGNAFPAVILRSPLHAVIRSYARLAGIRREDGRVSDADIDRAVAAGRVGIEVVLEETK